MRALDRVLSGYDTFKCFNVISCDDFLFQRTMKGVRTKTGCSRSILHIPHTMGSTFSQLSLNIESPDVTEDSHREKPEGDLLKKMTAFLLAEGDLPFNALSLKHVELFLHCRSSNDVSSILDEVDGFYDPYFDTTLGLIIFINAERS